MPDRRLAAVALALVALVVGTGWLLLARHAPTDVRRSVDDAETQRGGAALDARDGESAAASSSVSSNATPSATSAERATTATLLRLVDARTGAPLPGAALRCAPWPASGGIDEFSADQAVDGATARIADDAGRVELPPLYEGVVVAHTDALWGWARWIRGAPPPSELRLDVDRELRVQVLTPLGVPVVDVGLVLSGNTRRVRTTRAPDGIARFPATDFTPSKPSNVVRLVATLDALSAEPYSIELVADDLGGAPRVLRAPQPGTVDVHVRELDGRPVVDGTHVWLQLDPVDWSDKPWSERASEDRGAPRRRVRVVARDGRARFAVAASEVPLYVECWRAPSPGRGLNDGPDTRWPSARAAGRAPRAGESARIEAVIAAEWGVLAGRAVDEAGAPLAQVPLSIHAVADAPAIAHAVTNAAGAFWIECNGPAWSSATALDFATSGAKLRRARIALDADRAAIDAGAAPGIRRLGDVALPAFGATRLRGRLTGPPEAPRDGVIVHVETPGRMGWYASTKASARSGAFDVELDPSWGALRLTARTNGWESLPQRCDPWSEVAGEPVALELVPWGALVGRILPPEGATAAELGLELHVNMIGRGPPKLFSELDEDGRWRSPPLESGEYALGVRLRGLRIDLEQIKQLRVEPGRACNDPRLEPIDLSRALRGIDLELVDEDGADVANAELGWRPRGGRGAPMDLGEALTPETWVPARGARLRQWLKHERVDVLVRAPGFLEARVDDVRGTQRIVLRRTRDLVVELSAASQRPDASLELWIYVQRDVDGSVVGPVFGARVDADGRARVGIDGSGRFRVAVMTTPGFKPMTKALALAHERCGLVLDLDDAAFTQPLILDVRSSWWTGPDAKR